MLYYKKLITPNQIKLIIYSYVLYSIWTLVFLSITFLSFYFSSFTLILAPLPLF